METNELGIKKGRMLSIFSFRQHEREGASRQPFFPHISPWHVQQTLRTAPCAPNTNKSGAAGCWHADILLPSPVCRAETKVSDSTHTHTLQKKDTTRRIDNKPIRADCLTQITLELLGNEDDGR